MELSSSFQLPETDIVNWKIHYLPVKMGSDPCSEQVLGDCYCCFPPQDPQENRPKPQVDCECIKGDLNVNKKLAKCAQLIGKEGIIGRSIVLTVQSRSSSSSKPSVYCSTIFDEDQISPDFVSAISWLARPFAGFVAFRKQSSMQSYIILNVTRIDNWSMPTETFKWEIRNADNTLFNPTNLELDSSQCSENMHKYCAEGDLSRKHSKLVLNNNGINLQMVVDVNLDSSMLTGKYLVISNITNGTSEWIVSHTKIEDLSPIQVEVSFTDGSVLTLLQRDDWSNIKHQYSPVDKNTPGGWMVTVHQVPTIQIFTGEIWDCEKTWTSWTEATFLPHFKVNFH